MNETFVLFAYLVNSIITIQLALTLLSNQQKFKKVLIVSIFSCLFDFLLKEYLIPQLHLFEFTHLLTGFIFLAVISRYFFNLNYIGAFCVSILSYLLGGIGEFIIIILLSIITGLEFLKSLEGNKIVLSLFALLGTTTLLIPLFYLRIKNIQLIKLPINRNN